MKSCGKQAFSTFWTASESIQSCRPCRALRTQKRENSLAGNSRENGSCIRLENNMAGIRFDRPPGDLEMGVEETNGDTFYHSSFSFFNQLNVWRWSPSGHQKCIGMNCGCHHVASSPTGPIYCLRATHQPCTYESLSSNPYSNSTPSTLPRIQLLHTITTLINNSAVVASVPVGP